LSSIDVAVDAVTNILKLGDEWGSLVLNFIGSLSFELEG
jgi:hypothetical protein